MTTAWLHQPPKPLPSICSPYPQKPSPDPQIPIGRASRSAEHKRPAVSSPEGCPTPADRVRASRPATADVRQPLTVSAVPASGHCVQSGDGPGHQPASHDLPETRQLQLPRLEPATHAPQLVGLPSTGHPENSMGSERQQRYSLPWRILPWLRSSGDCNNHQDTPPSFQRRTQDSAIARRGGRDGS